MHSSLHTPTASPTSAHPGHNYRPATASTSHSTFPHSQPVGGIDTADANLLDGGVINLPWCQSCRPYVQILLGQGFASISGQPSASASGLPSGGNWAFSSPFSNYICVPALVHQSQFALFASSAAATDTSVPPLSHSNIPPLDQSSPSLKDAQQPPLPRSSPSLVQRKTRGVKIACTNCRVANKRCDEGRPCKRCIKSGLEDSCVSAERKPRRRAVRQTATTTAAITVSTTSTQALDTPVSTPEAEMYAETSTDLRAAPTPTSSAAAGTPSYVDDTTEIADGASHSSPSNSSAFADFDGNNFDNNGSGPQHQHHQQHQQHQHQHQHQQPEAPNYAVHANFWTSHSSFPPAGQQQFYGDWWCGGDQSASGHVSAQLFSGGPGISMSLAQASGNGGPGISTSQARASGGGPHTGNGNDGGAAFPPNSSVGQHF